MAIKKLKLEGNDIGVKEADEASDVKAGSELENKIKEKVALLGNESASGQPYHFPYHIGDLRFDTEDSKIKGTLFTITLDNEKTLNQYPLEVQITGKQNQVVYQDTVPTTPKEGDVWATDGGDLVVSANPTEAATSGALNKLKIGDNIYSVGGSVKTIDITFGKIEPITGLIIPSPADKEIIENSTSNEIIHLTINDVVKTLLSLNFSEAWIRRNSNNQFTLGTDTCECIEFFADTVGVKTTSAGKPAMFEFGPISLIYVKTGPAAYVEKILMLSSQLNIEKVLRSVDYGDKTFKNKYEWTVDGAKWEDIVTTDKLKEDMGLNNVTNDAQLKSSDKVTSIDSSSTDSQIPTAKAVYDFSSGIGYDEI